ncbi:class I SAM-dependent DNA methyltransferase [Rhodopseudomonas palustris]|uniref:site-specific DNA-methyltransferase (adenine-specific) n=1 Tax=Rhodopseudomonas palustris TaxID=1076 RepID=A0A418V1T0_RHOPL|nr:DNA methyltransferase [Rhodopseudomonas palustris]RJF69844.1 class I SAM-dependent DNA methyltransferase [Rhodopseudomonas palustris]
MASLGCSDGNSSVSSIEQFIARWQGREGGQERANYVSFLTELIALLGLPRPDPADATHEHNDYVFERAVKKAAEDTTSYGRIDLYKKNSFVLEAKQSRWQGQKKEVSNPSAAVGTDTAGATRGRRGADRAWDVLMLNAKRQAEEYARALPASHGWPPFILVCDVGHCIEVYADFTGQGKNYTQFPDRQSFRIYLEDLRDDVVRERLRKIWLEPQALDPAQQSARVTRDIAKRLAQVSVALEKQNYAADDVAMFLMRCLFTMFAEDVGLLPDKSFKHLLEDCERNPEAFVHDVGQLWEAMDTGQWAHALKTKVKKFNGEFFKSRAALPLGGAEIGKLREAAEYNWNDVDPSIFGTLLEQALDPTERKKLGAHYTPRAYVERLVIATIIEPLREDWRNVQATAETLRGAGDLAAAAAAVQAFHDKLCETRVLDPACGTGNFLYVSLELMKRLEGEVLEALLDLGGQEALRGLGSHSVDPHQFLGLEINPRAAAIAELVLWIGYLQWHFRTKGAPPDEPILRAFKNIKVKNAVLDWGGAPLPKIVDGKETYPNPRRPDWPAAEFIVGNPPFIGGKDIRARVPYAEALWAAHAHMNESADFVMYWWDRAAELLTRKGAVLRRFGFVTTNSISQVFQRRVMEKHLKAKKPISLIMAIPDHPWTKATPDAAAVRIAMTVGVAGTHEGVLHEVTQESKLDTDSPEISLKPFVGMINSDITIGSDVTLTASLEANEGICSPGVKLHGAGFLVTPVEADHLGLRKRSGLDAVIKRYRNGRDLMARARELMAIDLDGYDIDEVRKQFPEVYQHLLTRVKPERDRNNEEYRRVNWWLFGRRNTLMRGFTSELQRYIATVETAKHRVFQFLDASILPDNMLVAIGSDDAAVLGILSSRIHVVWALRAGGWLGVGNDPRYSKSRCFDPFPFPDANPIQKQTIRVIAEELDAHRKRVLAEHPHLTLTGLYNVLERIKAGAVPHAQPSSPGLSRGSTPSGRARKKGVDGRDEPGHDGEIGVRSPGVEGNVLTPDEQRIFDDGLVLILKELHDRLDVAVAEAYGWPADLSDDEILARLVALNKERAAEEKRGLVRWLRPDYQIPRFAKGVDQQAAKEEGAQIAASLDLGETKQKQSFPAGAVEQTAAVFAALAAAAGPLDAKALAAQFKRTKTTEKKIAEVLASLARLGYVASADGVTFALRRVA